MTVALIDAWSWRRLLVSEHGPDHAATRHVLLTLSLHADNNGTGAFPSIQTLVAETRLSERAVRTHLLRAETEGWIERRTRGGGQGWRRYEYLLRVPERAAPGAGPSPERAEPPAAPSGTDVRHVVPERAAPDDMNVRHLVPERAAPGAAYQITTSSETSTTTERTRSRGSRLPLGWQLDDTYRVEAVRLGLSGQRVELEAAKFRDYWHAKPGKDGVKLDWLATWRNWVRRALEHTPPAAPSPYTRVDPDAPYLRANGS